MSGLPTAALFIDQGVPPAHDAPQFSSGIPQSVTLYTSDTLNISLQATSLTASDVAFSIINTPSWSGGGSISIVDENQAAFSATLLIDPNGYNVGVYEISIVATDNFGAQTESGTISIYVESINAPVFRNSFTDISMKDTDIVDVPISASTDSSYVNFSIDGAPMWSAGGSISIAEEDPTAFTATLHIAPDGGNSGEYTIRIVATDSNGISSYGQYFTIYIRKSTVIVSNVLIPGRYMNDNVDYSSQSKTKVYKDFVFSEWPKFGKSGMRIDAQGPASSWWLDPFIEQIKGAGYTCLMRLNALGKGYNATADEIESVTSYLVKRYKDVVDYWMFPNEPTTSTTEASFTKILNGAKTYYESALRAYEYANMMPWSGIGSLQEFDREILRRGITQFSTECVSCHDYDGSFLEWKNNAVPAVNTGTSYLGKWPILMDEAESNGWPRRKMFTDEWGCGSHKFPGPDGAAIDKYEWKALVHLLGYYALSRWGYYDHSEYCFAFSFGAGSWPKSFNMYEPVVTGSGNSATMVANPEEPVRSAVRDWNNPNKFRVDQFEGGFETVGDDPCGQALIAGYRMSRPWQVSFDPSPSGKLSLSPLPPFKEWGRVFFLDDGIDSSGSGSGYLKITGGQKTKVYRVITGLDVNRTYTARCKIKTNGTATGTFAVQGYDPYHGAYEKSADFGGSDYQSVGVTFTPRHGTCVVSCDRRDGGSGNAFFDDVEVF